MTTSEGIKLTLESGVVPNAESLRIDGGEFPMRVVMERRGGQALVIVGGDVVRFSREEWEQVVVQLVQQLFGWTDSEPGSCATSVEVLEQELYVRKHRGW